MSVDLKTGLNRWSIIRKLVVMAMSWFTKHLNKEYIMLRHCKNEAQGNKYAIKNENLEQIEK